MHTHARTYACVYINICMSMGIHAHDLHIHIDIDIDRGRQRRRLVYDRQGGHQIWCAERGGKQDTPDFHLSPLLRPEPPVHGVCCVCCVLCVVCCVLCVVCCVLCVVRARVLYAETSTDARNAS